MICQMGETWGCLWWLNAIFLISPNVWYSCYLLAVMKSQHCLSEADRESRCLYLFSSSTCWGWDSGSSRTSSLARNALGQQTFYEKGVIVNIFHFAGHVICCNDSAPLL